MRKKAALTVALLVLVVAPLSAHTMFLKLSTYFLEPNTETTVALVNGTFEESENAIARNRMTDVSIVDGDGTVRHPDTSQWHDEGHSALLTMMTGTPGTAVIGVSTRPRTFTLTAEEFNNYLRHDGVVDVLAARKDNGTLDQEARERYSKHVKALVQVGDTQTDTYRHRLGYPIEIVPQQNPYALGVGDTLPVKVLRDGAPVSDQVVYANYEGHHAHGADGEHQEAVQTRTNGEGIARIPLEHQGRWYVRLIHMEKMDADVDYESNWATLTFEIDER